MMHWALKLGNASHIAEGHVARPANAPKDVVSEAEYAGRLLVVNTEVNFLRASTLNKSTDGDTEQSQR
jgi:hypothetical protein